MTHTLVPEVFLDSSVLLIFLAHERAARTRARSGEHESPEAATSRSEKKSKERKKKKALGPDQLINSNRDAFRKAREAFLISKGKTLEPSGVKLG